MEQGTYRIIDANFNRAREAVRMIEEYCRFVLNSAVLTERSKNLRQKLCIAIKQLDSTRLMTARDTIADVGANKPQWHTLKRDNLKDCLTAACKRLVEALRVLAETTQTLNPSVADELEDLRYTAYTLEKNIMLLSNTSRKFKDVKLYVVITSNLPAEVLSLTACCVAAKADCIQLRAKQIKDDKFFAIACEFTKLCHDEGALSIINDRTDIAIASGADGVHLGQNDMPIEQAYKLQTHPLIIGKSTHSVKQLKAACRQSVTYVGLGPVFATPTKPTAEAVGLEYIRQATDILNDTAITGVAIGGINFDNAGEVINAGATTIAVCRAVTDAKNPTQACRQLKEKITSLISAKPPAQK